MSPEKEKPEEEGNILKLIRVASMLVDRFIENKEQREKYFELVDKATEELKVIEG